VAKEAGVSLRAQSWLRFAAAAALLASTALYLHARGQEWISPPHLQVTGFPREVGDWQGGQTLPFSAETLQILGPGEFLERIYQRPHQPAVDLFLAYFPSQRTGDTIHSPKHCLPGAGWEPIQSSLVQLAAGEGRTITVNYWVIAKGEQRQVALYWYQAHGRVLANEFRAKFYQVWDAMRLSRTDGSLIRVITPVTELESIDSAKRRAVAFSEQLVPMLGAYIPN
jgi:EpsI family protein